VKQKPPSSSFLKKEKSIPCNRHSLKIGAPQTFNIAEKSRKDLRRVNMQNPLKLGCFNNMGSIVNCRCSVSLSMRFLSCAKETVHRDFCSVVERPVSSTVAVRNDFGPTSHVMGSVDQKSHST